MLGVTADKDKIKYPILASYKLDGIRCLFKDGQMLSRSLKPIPNKQLQKRFQNLKDLSFRTGVIFDGEIYSPLLTFQEITHFVMTENIENELVPISLIFNCFDIVSFRPFSQRYETYKSYLANEKHVKIVKQTLINNEEELDTMFDNALNNGYEGLIIRNPDAPYKFGRSTINEGYMLKMKPFVTIDGKIKDIIERQENLNESKINELGYSYKSSSINNKKNTGIASCFVVDYEGKDVKVTITGTEEFRRDIWENKEQYKNKYIEYKFMKIGLKELPRHPVFVRFRDDKNY